MVVEIRNIFLNLKKNILPFWIIYYLLKRKKSIALSVAELWHFLHANWPSYHRKNILRIESCIIIRGHYYSSIIFYLSHTLVVIVSQLRVTAHYITKLRSLGFVEVIKKNSHIPFGNPYISNWIIRHCISAAVLFNVILKNKVSHNIANAYVFVSPL